MVRSLIKCTVPLVSATDKRAEIEKAMGEMMGALKQRMGPDKILLANNAYSDDAKYVLSRE